MENPFPVDAQTKKHSCQPLVAHRDPGLVVTPWPGRCDDLTLGKFGEKNCWPTWCT